MDGCFSHFTFRRCSNCKAPPCARHASADRTVLTHLRVLPTEQSYTTHAHDVEVRTGTVRVKTSPVQMCEAHSSVRRCAAPTVAINLASHACATAPVVMTQQVHFVDVMHVVFGYASRPATGVLLYACSAIHRSRLCLTDSRRGSATLIASMYARVAPTNGGISRYDPSR